MPASDNERWQMLAKHSLGEITTLEYVTWLLRQGDEEWSLVMVYGHQVVNEARSRV